MESESRPGETGLSLDETGRWVSHELTGYVLHLGDGRGTMIERQDEPVSTSAASHGQPVLRSRRRKNIYVLLVLMSFVAGAFTFTVIYFQRESVPPTRPSPAVSSDKGRCGDKPGLWSVVVC